LYGFRIPELLAEGVDRRLQIDELCLIRHCAKPDLIFFDETIDDLEGNPFQSREINRHVYEAGL